MDSSSCNSVVSVSLPFPSRFAFNRLLPFRFVAISPRYHFVGLPFRCCFIAVSLPCRFRISHRQNRFGTGMLVPSNDRSMKTERKLFIDANCIKWAWLEGSNANLSLRRLLQRRSYRRFEPSSQPYLRRLKKCGIHGHPRLGYTCMYLSLYFNPISLVMTTAGTVE